ncbi:MAG: penicillin-binding protein 1B, partial [Gammaproteobacteria bacterium]
LELLGYQEVGQASRSGQFSKQGDRIKLVTRGFKFPDAVEPARRLTVSFSNDRVSKISFTGREASPSIARLEPFEIGGIHPGIFEDRVLLRFSDVQRVFLERLIAVEDKRYFEHPGIDIKGVSRAIITNLVAGKMRQGGSTITQQLIKNLYLTRERSLRRKFQEALMALSLERRYSKQEILETYINEIYLGQDGNRAIHGFGLGAEFYFDKPLVELSIAEQALLIGLIKGPSAYNPRKNPKLAQQRRDTVLKVLLTAELISTHEYETAVRQPVQVSSRIRGNKKLYAAFTALVHRRLLANYAAEDLQTQGLKIFTTAAPLMQQQIAKAQQEFMNSLETRVSKRGEPLQIATVWADPVSAEVKALTGGRDHNSNYNRALFAKRQVGSLIKPFVVAEALGRPNHFQLGSLVHDQELSLTDQKGQVWAPQNYDRQTHGDVTILDTLVRSYNLATIDLGLGIGLGSVAKRLRAMGLQREKIPLYPSLLLGAIEMTPFEVAQLYHTIANQGFFSPLKAIRTVVDADGVPLREARTTVRQALDSKVAYLTTFAMSEVVNRGTAQGLKRLVPEALPIAGKTGTTDDTRDSWFAGFGGNLLGVVWIGHDNGQPTKLTGASGALRAWGSMAKIAGVTPLTASRPGGVELVWVDPNTGEYFSEQCGPHIAVPVIANENLMINECDSGESSESDSIETLWDGIKRMLNGGSDL